MEVVDAYEDVDKDSIAGSEAMEDNTPEDGMVAAKRRRGKAPQIPRDQMNEEIRSLQERMEQAQIEDNKAVLRRDPAVEKVCAGKRGSG